MKIISKFTFLASAATVALLAGCSKNDSQVADLEERVRYLESQEPTLSHGFQIEEIGKLYPSAKSTESGLHYIVEQEGDGETPSKGQTVTAHYHGTLLNGDVFDSSVERGKPFQFPVGMGRVIKGWDEAFLDMKKGEKRKLILPAQIAYGLRGSPPVIPPNSVLVFDVELIDFK
ncbi:FKBP-type peptidyl-prolyl cis-trans isomerase [Pelagicoccus sp. NFK12]|uniref:Peptidyl-prolyl cis-trans isomerase n=1 Tax=Pelagicoccus enzymogenes TaxID=2773457 RepID=A0A927F6I4_9BACT|nr:FKBP-type peptidyl-prolyl cis-trans isomerase [Pelagicoccus enzymogenes]MBD5779289.1 FKBP-type peptidyl-prolyl cis-trans isomerase [Pelagicoccus enzymogenes]MDQ8198359.1 FKBP-type peptidyl-prolyl cis-trans isomerase [Pelagicoccus enzymogenes]